MSSETPGYNDFVFINCPFDSQYMPLLQAIVYTIYRCGFFPRTAFEEDDASDIRLDKIMRFIKGCKYGVHDISRTEIDDSGFPRFNMPFELGIFFGAKCFGVKEQKIKNALVLEGIKFSYMRSISDLNGIDTKAHNNNPHTAIKKVRDWLSTASGRTDIPGHTTIVQEYMRFRSGLPVILFSMGLDIDDISFTDYCEIVENIILNNIRQQSIAPK